jgi:hypothetical protein
MKEEREIIDMERWNARIAQRRQRAQHHGRLGVLLLKLHLLWPNGPWLWLYRRLPR